MTTAMTRDRIRAAERAAGVYDNPDTYTGTILAHATITIAGTDEETCDKEFLTTYGQEAFDMIGDGFYRDGVCTYLLEEGFDCDGYNEKDILDDFAGTRSPLLPALGVDWDISVDSCHILTIHR